jgi:hypothetical protein
MRAASFVRRACEKNFPWGSRLAKLIWYANLLGESIVENGTRTFPRTRFEVLNLQGCHATRAQTATS